MPELLRPLHVRACRGAVTERPELQGNVDALKKVLPAPLGVDDIAARLGAVWISPAVHKQFLTRP